MKRRECRAEALRAKVLSRKMNKLLALAGENMKPVGKMVENLRTKHREEKEEGIEIELQRAVSSGGDRVRRTAVVKFHLIAERMNKRDQNVKIRKRNPDGPLSWLRLKNYATAYLHFKNSTN